MNRPGMRPGAAAVFLLAVGLVAGCGVTKAIKGPYAIDLDAPSAGVEMAWAFLPPTDALEAIEGHIKASEADYLVPDAHRDYWGFCTLTPSEGTWSVQVSNDARRTDYLSVDVDDDEASIEVDRGFENGALVVVAKFRGGAYDYVIVHAEDLGASDGSRILVGSEGLEREN